MAETGDPSGACSTCNNTHEVEDMEKKVTILTGEPTISVMASMAIDWDGVREMAQWVKTHRPECIPDGWDPDAPAVRDDVPDEYNLFPHDHWREGFDESAYTYETPDHVAFLTDNELLAELCGRKCYDSFGLKAGQKSNQDYLKHTQMLTDPKVVASGIVVDSDSAEETAAKIADAIQAERDRVPHASITYHAKMSFFIAGVSRRVSHELIRNYVGADRDEEGAPSQESTRFTHHYGFYVAPPRVVSDPDEMKAFETDMQGNYYDYLSYVNRQIDRLGGDKVPTSERKKIYEAASARLSHSCETSFVWTTNPGALAKLFKERDNDFADAEFRRFAKKWKRICLARWPNLFPMFKPEPVRG